MIKPMKSSMSFAPDVFGWPPVGRTMKDFGLSQADPQKMFKIIFCPYDRRSNGGGSYALFTRA
jgi:hypothetical protein